VLPHQHVLLIVLVVAVHPTPRHERAIDVNAVLTFIATLTHPLHIAFRGPAVCFFPLSLLWALLLLPALKAMPLTQSHQQLYYRRCNPLVLNQHLHATTVSGGTSIDVHGCIFRVHCILCTRLLEVVRR
jgi:hypothetical protein